MKFSCVYVYVLAKKYTYTLLLAYFCIILLFQANFRGCFKVIHWKFLFIAFLFPDIWRQSYLSIAHVTTLSAFNSWLNFYEISIIFKVTLNIFKQKSRPISNICCQSLLSWLPLILPHPRVFEHSKLIFDVWIVVEKLLEKYFYLCHQTYDLSYNII